jgi:voltage-gated potassium channel
MNATPDHHLDYTTPVLERWRRWTDIPLLILAIGSLPILALELARDDLVEIDRTFLEITNIVVLVAFALDYFVELYLARDRRSYVRHEWAAALIVVTQALAVVPALAPFGFVRVFRAGRALRIVVMALRVFAVGGIAAREGRAVLRRHAAAFALGLAGFTWVTSAVLFTIVEDVGRRGRIDSFFDALWWSLATITTVGYGDLYPVTAEGRIVGGFTMVVGITTFAILTAKIAEFLVRGDVTLPSVPTAVTARERQERAARLIASPNGDHRTTGVMAERVGP